MERRSVFGRLPKLHFRFPVKGFPFSFRKQCLRASFTVEAALLSPFLIMVVFGLLYLDFHVMNRCLLFSASCEQAITGHEAEPLLTMAGEGTVKEAGRKGRHYVVTYRSGTADYSGCLLSRIEESGSYEERWPVVFIRKTRAAADLAGIGDD